MVSGPTCDVLLVGSSVPISGENGNHTAEHPSLQHAPSLVAVLLLLPSVAREQPNAKLQMPEPHPALAN